MGFIAAAALAACTGSTKEDAKGQVDESEPPAIPTANGKADSSARLVATDVQSPHPYANNLDKFFQVSLTSLPSCAQRARFHFKVLRTEAGYDYVHVQTAAGTLQSFDGTRDNAWTNWFPVTAVPAGVRLETDESITRHGFEIDQIEWEGAPTACPQVASCGAGQINVAKPAAVCECAPQPQCVAIDNVVVAHRMALRFNNTEKRAAGAVATFTHPGPADGAETDTVGTIDTVRLGELVRRAATLGLLQGPGYMRTVGVDQFRDELLIKAGAYQVAFLAGEGNHDANVQSLINDFEALFTCEGAGGLTCGGGYVCEQGSCIEDQSCVCPAIYDPVCGTNGQTYSSNCAAACASASVAHDGECGEPGDTCGGMLGLTCLDDNRCRYAAGTFDAPYPDASGTCVARNYCDAPPDCAGLPHIAVPGSWACNSNTCAWQTGPSWRAVTDGHFETTRPYANNTSVWKQLYLPAEAQFLRLNVSRFATEANYDKLEVWTWQNGAWTKVRTYSGSTGPALTDELAGVYHYLRFVSDSSVTGDGVALDAEWR